MGDQLLGVRQLQDIALVDDGNAIGNVTHHRKVVGDEQVGDAALLLQLAQQVEHLRPDGHIQCADGLVRHDELRLYDQRPGNADALALPAGKFVGEAAGKLRQQTHIQKRLPHLLLPLRGGKLRAHVLQALAHDVAYLGALVQGGLRVLKDHLNFPGELLIQRAGNFAVDALTLV